ncbi:MULTISPECIES: DUF3369 domain-containing protein [Pseudoalteromonas]|uniref:DUF3369 domain-containing protein n=1 Tax=Pseudoalteromonas maricaloris TaxID=184924 RepID=A0A8I2HBC4_9GAMM|nr:MULTISPECIES: DUF3369 domain-containing protein [Pseudoalteromonas]MCG7541877.1 DUF3369 domain-containing protein [Pseudoalteromonas sp. OF7H-1]KID38944.1 phosphodiesterase [Pseudoalteromonas flavipulchra NCIMB 2033 = ATCC BAA-314]KJZ04172.1 phosphodiesterase [Pseudoalteromonas piscicida]MBD0784413.1 DUF3369 domain-containing protein [Pseudoalteromonas flavipulchra]MBE0374117.1 hypothetical protein [Pseudoalteromonas flavipulchra NCIMB 2033 = ATCC BAA-314]
MSGFLFSDEVLESPTNKMAETYWDILVVDDEEDIHQVTKLVLSGFKFENKALRFHHAYSAQEAKAILDTEQNISVGLIDVVMESNHAGLDLVRYIRDDLANFDIRLVLRTGQPGEAPEESVIRDYDINDYKNKTELTAVKLKTLLYSALRAHRDIQTIEKHKMGLERIIDASSNFLKCSNIQDFASTILSHVSAVMGLSDSEIYCAAAVNHQANEPTKFKLLAASGAGVEPSNVTLPENVQNLFIETHNKKASLKTRNEYIGYFPSREGSETMIYVSKDSELHSMDFQLLEFFANNIALAYDNLKLRETVKDSQKELSYILGEAVEKRSKETGSHVKRVAHYSMLLAQLYGLSHYQAEIIKLASPLHDIGKISIPDQILNKPGKLTDEEWIIMQTHAQQGFEILKNSTNEILQCGALIAHQHHEKWDGSGYPRGLKGEQINIVGRITALADVFDALGSERCYKPAWPLDKVIDLLNTQSGKQFEPKLVDLFLKNLEQFIEIRDRYPD